MKKKLRKFPKGTLVCVKWIDASKTYACTKIRDAAPIKSMVFGVLASQGKKNTKIMVGPLMSQGNVKTRVAGALWQNGEKDVYTIPTEWITDILELSFVE